MRAEVYGYSSDSGWMEQNSVNTAPQPPSAFMPRKWACAPGLSAPGPAQCEVCQNRLRSVLGPILIGSNNTSCLGSRDMCLLLHRCVSPPGAVRYPRPPPRPFIMRAALTPAPVGNFHDIRGKGCLGHRLD